MSEDFDLVLRTDCLVDGSGSPPRAADVGIRGDRIAHVGPRDSLRGTKTRTATALAPGFIDIHAHGDLEPILYPRAECKVLQGVTTELSGNCGSAPFPLQGVSLERLREKASLREIDIDWSDAAGYFERLEREGTGINRAFLAGHNTLRIATIGYEDRAPSAENLAAMQRLLREALAQGAFGLSTGLIYPPGCYAETDEIIALAQEAASVDALYSTHMRSESDKLIPALEETCRIARDAGVRVQVSHLKAAGRENWSKIREVEAILRRAMGESDIAGDRYPYLAGATDLDAVLPSWSYEGGADAEITRILDPTTRARLLADLREHDAPYWDGVVISSVETDASRGFEGLTVNEAAARLDLPPPEAVLELLVRERTRIDALFFGMSEENMKTVLSWPFVMVGSDSTARDFSGRAREGKPHPRTFGTFARILGKFVREERVLSLEEAVRKMTSFPAARMGLPDRGQIREGFFADLVALDPDTVADAATYANPWQKPVGVEFVLVNGRIAVEGGEHTGVLAGRVLRRRVTPPLPSS